MVYLSDGIHVLDKFFEMREALVLRLVWWIMPACRTTNSYLVDETVLS
jgi:hypothetical protein